MSKANQPKSILKVTDHLVTGEQFSLHYNPESDMLITRPQPKDLSKYYSSEDYISHTDSSKSITDKLYQWVKGHAIQSKYKLLGNYVSPGKLLDFGSGTGDFLAAGALKNWEGYGVETNAQARTLATQKGAQVVGDKAQLESHKFKAITFWHVLEHLPDYQEVLSWCYDHLEPDGVLIIAVPNYKSWDARYFKSYWAAYDAPRHLWHFSKNSIAHICAGHFSLVKIKPMLFDSFYVSLLSLKHKNGSSNLIVGFILGLWSNIKALGSKEYSSQIYVLKKAK